MNSPIKRGKKDNNKIEYNRIDQLKNLLISQTKIETFD